ncbi:PQQ-binding-like beta-propeller repeat protein [Actinomadura alba]|uniref:PQQ-binding-like beta-propeller repeat protein n=1 Tax=Actinomadura alba TaxID=406431 RepID=UPI0035E41A80
MGHLPKARWRWPRGGRWRYALGRSTALPAVADGMVFAAPADGALFALRASRGV